MIAVLVPVAIAVTLACFAWPSARLEPRDLPIGVAGTAQATAAAENRLSAQPGSFDVHHYADEAAAREAIEDREVYAAIVAAPNRQTLLTASAGSPLIAGFMREHFGSDPHVQVVDVVPADPDDPRGSAFGSAVFPLILSSVIAAVFLAKAGRPHARHLAALLAAAAAGGVTAITMVQTWLGVIGGSWIENAGVVALTILAIASFLVALVWLFGNIGLAVGAPLMILLGNPWSGISSAPELLPKPAGLIGQLLPPGAGGNLLRSTAFFDGAGSAGHLAVLAAWALAGLTCLLLAAVRGRRLALRPLAPGNAPERA